MIVTAEGCIVHRNVQFDRCEISQSIFKCQDCGVEFVEHEDTGCGG